MATINLGRIKPVFRGAYAGGTAYVVDDIVTSGNETFICILASTGNATSNATYWTKLAAKGGDVTQLSTQGDVLYRDASGVARLAAGTAGQALITGGAGANPSWGAASIAWQAVTTGTTLTAVAGRAYPINTTSNVCTVTLPTSASVGDTIEFLDYARTWGTNAVTLEQNLLKYQGLTQAAGSSAIYSTAGQHITLTYVDATQGWIPTVDDDVAFQSRAPYDLDYLVVAGAGGGGNDANGGNNSSGGGGGGGGSRTGTLSSQATGVLLTATVGAGGAGGGVNLTAPNGTASSMAGTGVTTITSAGGGGGGAETVAGAAGGCGGGGGYPNDGPAGAAGAGNTPSTSPVQGFAGEAAGGSPTHAGGGGGSSEAGGTDGVSQGGDGISNSITGSALNYGGGGASGCQNPLTSTGGAGGGANGGPTKGVDGTDGLGGGASGSGGSTSPIGQSGGVGGSGVVIFSIPTASYSGIYTGSPTISVSGSDTIIKFLATGTLTT